MRKAASELKGSRTQSTIFNSTGAAIGEKAFLGVAAVLALREHMGLDEPLSWTIRWARWI